MKEKEQWVKEEEEIEGNYVNGCVEAVNKIIEAWQ